MSVYIAVSTDAFEETRAKAKRDKATYANVRRPLRGIQVKENTYGILRVLTASGDPIPLFDSSAAAEDVGSDGIGRSPMYANFLITGISEQRAEKQQIIQTFGEDYVYFFGEQPRFLSVQGALINTKDFNWKSEFWTNYDQYLRGTKLVERNARLYFYFDDIVVEGYMIAADTAARGDLPHLLNLNFSLFITNYAILSTVGSVYFGKSSSGQKGGTALEPILPRGNAGPMAQPGGLTGFLARSGLQDAAYSVQAALEKIRNAFYSRALVVPSNLETTVVVDPITNLGQYGSAPTNRPIYEMTDEYVERAPANLSGRAKVGYLAEQKRVEAQLALRDPVALEARARAEFEKAGIDTGTPSAMMSILGRGAFAAAQYTAPFALKKISGGTIGQVDQATQLLR